MPERVFLPPSLLTRASVALACWHKCKRTRLGWEIQHGSPRPPFGASSRPLWGPGHLTACKRLTSPTLPNYTRAHADSLLRVASSSLLSPPP